jgi:hypothetical protein
MLSSGFQKQGTLDFAFFTALAAIVIPEIS